MNTTIKLAVAGTLALGGYAADAQIANPSTGSSTVLLFAEVLSSSDSVIASYGANTGVSVASAYAGTSTATFAATANLSALFAADAAGDTLVWAVEGSSYTGSNNSTQYAPGKTMIVTTAGNPAQFPTRPTGSITGMNNALSNAISVLNTNLAGGTDVEGTATATAGVWDATSNNNISDWGGIESAITTGTGTVSLYNVTGTGSLTSKLATVTNGSVTFTSAGLVFAPGGGTVTTPLPPAVWLLGSGLLGLAGVARRKSKV
jgi:hypothetical protein